MAVISHRTRIAAPAEDVALWFERPGAGERLVPQWAHAGGRGELGGTFTRHIEPDGTEACFLEERVEAGEDSGSSASLRKWIERALRYRHAVAAADIVAHCRFRERGSLRILVSGSTGLLGSALVPFLTAGGHKVVRLARRPLPGGEEVVLWDPAAGRISSADLEGFDAIVHLSGEYIADGRWDKAKRERVWNSRVESTKLLVGAISKLQHPPRVLVCASGTGYYGEGGNDELTEDHSAGQSCFFVDMVREWEAAAQAATAAGVRVVNTRIGVVLTPLGGALKAMLPAFRLRLGAVIGSGREYTAWLTLDDLVGMMHFALMNGELRGPVNFAAPAPVTQRELARAVGHVLARPVMFKVPNAALRVLFSPELAEAMRWSQRVIPQRLLAAGYPYRHRDLEDGLRHVLGRG